MGAHFANRAAAVGSEHEIRKPIGREQFDRRNNGLLFPIKTQNVRAIETKRRLLDITLLVVSAPFVLPLFLLIALWVKIDSKGPVFYRQKRYGRDGKPFCLLKFRTMVPDAEAQKSNLAHLNEKSWPDFKITNDPRVTRVGRVLRHISLDELPQLLNVLRGEMSLVGPRACSISPHKYEAWQLRRLSVRPGIAGPAQIYNRHGSFTEKCKLDLEYIDDMGLRKDIYLLFGLAKKLVTSADGK